MSEKNVLVTGSKGIIGKILMNGLKGYSLTGIDLPEVDVRDYFQLKKSAKGKDSIIHLAWDTKRDNCFSREISLDNSLMFHNIYKAAIDLKIPRVIMASSVHADDFRDFKGMLMSPYTLPCPTSPYGAHKIFMESLGRLYSRKGLEVVCVRFGAVGYTDMSPSSEDPEGQILWLSKKDCTNLINAILTTKKIQENFAIVYGVSNNKKRIHNISNPFGWKAEDGCN